jgi:hypothetical protein
MTAPSMPEGYLTDSKGRLVPETMIRPADLLIDQTVKKIIGHGLELSARIARFRGHAYDDVGETLSLLADQYGTKLGSERGNATLTSFDGCQQVKVSVSDRITFGPELQIAKALIYRCIENWSAGSSPEIRALIDDAFQVSQEGKVNREALLRLRRLAIEDEQWRQAMAALTDSIRVIGSAEYVRLYRRATPRDRWELIPINLASAVVPPSDPD